MNNPSINSGQGLPAGTVTFLFTDIEGSTKLAQEHPEIWESLRARHHAILQSAMDAHNGYIFQIIGDAFCAAFHTAGDALRAVIKSQIDLHNENWGDTPIKVRMGIHTGNAQVANDNDQLGGYKGYTSMARVQRLMSAAHGGQTLISLATEELVRDDLPENISLRDMGERRLKDLIRPEHIYQLVIPNLPFDFPPLKTLDVYRHNLPVQMTSFIGREKEISEIRQSILAHRLITLTGSGGTGKTRLSLQVAADLLDQFPEGVWFVELAALSDPNRIPKMILSAFGIPEQPGMTVLQLLMDYLREKKILLALDNCEHLIEACAKLADTLLNSAHMLKIMATSREALGVKGEVVWQVPSLSLPDVKQLRTLEQLSQYEAVQLFIERATLVQPHFIVTNNNAPAVAQICFRLDGIPLALELAAARVKLLSVDQISSHLDDRFRLLTGGARTALPRQQTLRSMIDWSYDLLTESEKLLLRRLAVFAGGWTLELAEQICSDENIEQYEILDMLGKLVDKSLVTVNEDILGTRYRILETIRQYAREKLFESGEGEKVRDMHLNSMIKFAEEAEPEVRGHNQRIWLNRLDAEIENLRSALEWAQAQNAEACLRLASLLWRFWDIRGYGNEGLDWFTKAFALTEGLHTVTRARALARASTVANNLSEVRLCNKWAEEARTLSKELDDKPGLAMALTHLGPAEEALHLSREIGDHGLAGSNLRRLGWEAVSRNDLTSAVSLMEQGLKEVRLSGNERIIGFALQELSDVILAQGDAERAQNLVEEALSLAQEIGDKRNVIYCYCCLASVAFFLEDYDRSGQFAAEAYRLAQESSIKSYIGQSLIKLGYVDWAQGNISRFAERMEEALVIAKQTNYSWLNVDIVYFLGELSRLKGDFAQAKNKFAEALTIHREENWKIGYCIYLEGFGMLAIDQGQAERGARLLGARETLRAVVFTNDFYPFQIRERERHIITAREQLGEDAFNKSWAEGAAMSTEEATKYALEESNE